MAKNSEYRGRTPKVRQSKISIKSRTVAGISAGLIKMDGGAPKRPDWKTSHTFFCDESGNSGGRYFHPDQPIYAEGGWVIPHEHCIAASAYVTKLEKEHGYSPKTKGSALKSSAAGRAYMEEVFHGLGQFGVPFLYLVEKRYFVCSKAVETYFDPSYNCAIAQEETWHPAMRQMRADKLYAAPDSIIAAFAEAYRGQDALGIAAVGEDWEDFLIEKGDVVMATELRTCLASIAKDMAGEFGSELWPTLPNGIDSLNLPSIARVFQLVEQNCPSCDMVHDECASFEAIYRYVFNMVRNADSAVLEMVDGRKQTFGFARLNSLSFANSEMQPLLRASDYLVACCSDFARRAAVGEEIPSELARCAYPGLGGILSWALSHMLSVEQRMPQMGEVMASDAWVGRVFKQFYQITRPE